MTMYGHISVMPLLKRVALCFEVPLALAEVAGLSFNPPQKKINVAKYVFAVIITAVIPLVNNAVLLCQ